MSRVYLVVVRRPQGGPVHLANAEDETHFTSVCGGTFRGSTAVRPVSEWASKKVRHCADCLEAEGAARSIKHLAKIAGW